MNPFHHQNPSRRLTAISVLSFFVLSQISFIPTTSAEEVVTIDAVSSLPEISVEEAVVRLEEISSLTATEDISPLSTVSESITPFKASATILPNGETHLWVEVFGDGTAKVKYFSTTKVSTYDAINQSIKVGFSTSFGSEEWNLKIKTLTDNDSVHFIIDEFQRKTKESDQTYSADAIYSFSEEGLPIFVRSQENTTTNISESKTSYVYDENRLPTIITKVQTTLRLKDDTRINRASYTVLDREGRITIRAEKYLDGIELFDFVDRTMSVDKILAEINKYIQVQTVSYFEDSELKIFKYSVDFRRGPEHKFNVARRVIRAGKIYIVRGEADVLSQEVDDELFIDAQFVNDYWVFFDASYGLIFSKEVTTNNGSTTPDNVSSTRATIIFRTYKSVAVVDYPYETEVTLGDVIYTISINQEGRVQLKQIGQVEKRAAFGIGEVVIESRVDDQGEKSYSASVKAGEKTVQTYAIGKDWRVLEGYFLEAFDLEGNRLRFFEKTGQVNIDDLGKKLYSEILGEAVRKVETFELKETTVDENKTYRLLSRKVDLRHKVGDQWETVQTTKRLHNSEGKVVSTVIDRVMPDGSKVRYVEDERDVQHPSYRVRIQTPETTTVYIFIVKPTVNLEEKTGILLRVWGEGYILPPAGWYSTVRQVYITLWQSSPIVRSFQGRGASLTMTSLRYVE